MTQTAEIKNPKSEIINSLWISGPLQPVNLLTIRSFQEHGHEVVIWSFDKNITTECRVEDARQVMDEKDIFYYKNMLGGNPRFKFGGIAERLKAKLLYERGGFHSDLDVTCLRSFDAFRHRAYVFRPHPQGIVANIIKAPRHSDFAKKYVGHTELIDENNTHWEKSFLGLNDILAEEELQGDVEAEWTFGMDTDAYWKDYLSNNGKVPHPDTYAIHWCGAMGMQYEPGSFYESLLKKYKLA